MIMTNDERIKHLRDMLKEAASHLNHSMQQDGTADDVYMRDVESLAVAIRALEARGWAALERPIAREIKMLDAIFGVITDMLFECDRSMFSAVLNYWEEEQQANTEIECIALDKFRKDMIACVEPSNTNFRRMLTARVALLLLKDVYPEQEVTNA